MEPDWKSLPSLSSLRAFDQAARAGSFAGAARALNVTHAAVAQQVRALEGDLGVALLRRAGRGVALTPEGARLAQSLAEGFDRLAQGVVDLRTEAAGRPLRVTSTVFFGSVVLLPLLEEFWAEHPDIRLSLMPTQEALDLAREGLDLAIRTSMSRRPDWPGLQVEPLLVARRIVVGAPSLLGDGTTPLGQLPWIFERGVSFFEEPIRAVGVDPARVKDVWPGTAMLEVSAARRGLGLLIAADILVREDLASGRLRKVPIPVEQEVHYFAATPAGPMRPQTRLFVDWLKAALAARKGRD